MSVRVRNVGARAGDEVVQLYLHDVIAQVARPAKQLAGFARVTLEPGDAIDVRFRVHADRTAYTDRDLKGSMEPGDVQILVGNSSVKPALSRQGPAHRRDAGRRPRPPADDSCRPDPSYANPATRNNWLRLEGRVTTNGDERTTLATIASVAGVSVATVSKVVNGRPHVSPTTRALYRKPCSTNTSMSPAAPTPSASHPLSWCSTSL